MARLTDKDMMAIWRFDAARRILFDDGPHSMADFRSRGDNDVKPATLAQLRRYRMVEQVWDEQGDRKVWKLTAAGIRSEMDVRARQADKIETRRRASERQKAKVEQEAEANDLEVAGRIADWLDEHNLAATVTLKRIREGVWRSPTA